MASYCEKQDLLEVLFNGVLNFLPCKSMDWFFYDRDLHHDRVKIISHVTSLCLLLLNLVDLGLFFDLDRWRLVPD